MPRTLFTTAVSFALAAWAGAQGPTAADQLHMLRADQVLIGNLVDDGLGLANAGTPVERAEGCRRTAQSLAHAVGWAVDGRDADRVAELGGHLEVVVRDALVPTLDDARRMIPDESPDAARLKEVRRQAGADLDAVRAAIPTDGAVGGRTDVRAARGRLDGLRERLK